MFPRSSLLLAAASAILALAASPRCLAQQPPAATAAKAKTKWTPLSVKELATSLTATKGTTTSADLAAKVYRCFGKQSLSQGKAGAKVEETTVGWAVMSAAPARVVDGQDKLIGEMTAVGSDGLQVLVREMPNFADHSYKIEAAGRTLLAGAAHVEHYPRPAEAEPAADVPRGRLERFVFTESKVFPSTVRDVTVYVPAQYKPDASAALMVWQDGSRHADPAGQMRAPAVFDTLIHRGEMPITVGVFIDPGRRATQKATDKAGNRSFEYDSLGDAYARFVLEEVLPEVQKRYALTWSNNAAHHAIAGGSSGGICAFTVAWERPQQFGKVLSWVGSFVDLRGGHVYPAMIRYTEHKPIRVYLLDGRNDLDNPFGNWPLANQNMAAALGYMGYDYRFDYGDCFHGSKGMSASLPDALRWLWRK